MLNSKDNERNEWVFELTVGLMEEYWVYYKTFHPRATKHPLKADSKVKKLAPFPPSLNRILIMKNRIQANAFKSQWKDFTIYVCDKLGYRDLMLDKVRMEIEFYFGDKKPRDILDNYCLKYISDGFVGCNMLVDDNNFVVQSARYVYKGIDRDNPRTVIRIIKLREEELIK